MRVTPFLFFCSCFGTNTFSAAENDHVTEAWPNSSKEKDFALYRPLNGAVSVQLEFTSLIKKYIDLSRNLEILGLLINISMSEADYVNICKLSRGVDLGTT